MLKTLSLFLFLNILSLSSNAGGYDSICQGFITNLGRDIVQTNFEDEAELEFLNRKVEVIMKDFYESYPYIEGARCLRLRKTARMVIDEDERSFGCFILSLGDYGLWGVKEASIEERSCPWFTEHASSF